MSWLTRLLSPSRPPEDPSGDVAWLDVSGYEWVYAVGDVHGEYALMLQMEELIARDWERLGRPSACTLYVGDVIDRGAKSAHILDHLTRPSRHTMDTHVLRGNHEQFMLDFIDDPKAHLDWLSFGGSETLASYGIFETRSDFSRMRGRDIGALLTASIPEGHTKFLRALPHAADAGRFLFCHAGVDPTKPLAAQGPEDFMWARDRFMAHEGALERVVVHGHTPVARAAAVHHRVSIDTGAYSTGTLSGCRVNLLRSDLEILVAGGLEA